MMTLKPCPFCGSDGEHVQTDHGLGTVCNRYAVDCPEGRGGCGVRTGWHDTPRAAVEVWNRRVARGGDRAFPQEGTAGDVPLDDAGLIRVMREVATDEVDPSYGLDLLAAADRLEELVAGAKREVERLCTPSKAPQRTGGTTSHNPGCPLRHFSYEVGSGENIPDCTCSAASR